MRVFCDTGMQVVGWHSYSRLTRSQLRALLVPFGDKEYIELVIRLFAFQEYVKNQYGITMTPREIDTFLLSH